MCFYYLNSENLILGNNDPCSLHRSVTNEYLKTGPSIFFEHA